MTHNIILARPGTWAPHLPLGKLKYNSVSLGPDELSCRQVRDKVTEKIYIVIFCAVSNE